VRHIYMSLGFKRLITVRFLTLCASVGDKRGLSMKFDVRLFFSKICGEI